MKAKRGKSSTDCDAEGREDCESDRKQKPETKADVEHYFAQMRNSWLQQIGQTPKSM